MLAGGGSQVDEHFDVTEGVESTTVKEANGGSIQFVPGAPYVGEGAEI